MLNSFRDHAVYSMTSCPQNFLYVTLEFQIRVLLVREILVLLNSQAEIS